MPLEIVRTAVAGAEQSAADVRAAVRLRGARVLQRLDAEDARRRLDEAVEIISSLDDPPIAEAMRFAAVPIAATVAPDVAFRLLRDWRESFGRSGPPIDQTIHNMTEHGHRGQALRYLLDPDPALPFPFHLAMNVARDAESRTAVLRATLAALRRIMAPGVEKPFMFQLHSVLQTFSHQWTALPPEDALAAAREIAGWILAEPDKRTSSGFGGGDDSPRFSSSRESQLYQLLGPLQHLDPEFTRSLMADHPQLARAAARYPFGMESMTKETEHSAPPPPTAEQARAMMPDVIYFGSMTIPAAEALATGFAEPFASADRALAADMHEETGNGAPVECWPSTAEYRAILFHAGEREGRDATKYLSRIRSEDIRRLASIELAAALVGLPRIGDLTRGPGGGRGRKPSAEPSVMTKAGEAVLKRLMKRQQFEPLPPPRRPDLTPSMDVRIGRSAKKASERVSGGCGPDFWTIEGTPLKPVIARLWNVPETRVDLPASLTKDRYDFVLVLPHDGTQEEMRRLMRDGIAKHFAVTISRESRAMETLVVSAPHGTTLEASLHEHRRGGGRIAVETVTFMSRTSWQDLLTPSRLRGALGLTPVSVRASDLDAVFDLEVVRRDTRRDLDGYMREMSRRFSRWSADKEGALTELRKSMTMGDLCEMLESSLGEPVLDETGLNGMYDFALGAKVESTREFLGPLADHSGLVFTTARRDVPRVVVRP
jgi:uncharacterized protein (TIGR03435 family)